MFACNYCVKRRKTKNTYVDDVDEESVEVEVATVVVSEERKVDVEAEVATELDVEVGTLSDVGVVSAMVVVNRAVGETGKNEDAEERVKRDGREGVEVGLEDGEDKDACLEIDFDAVEGDEES